MLHKQSYLNSFYYSFSDFIANYKFIYKSWQEDHPEGYEAKFIEDLYQISNLKYIKKEIAIENPNIISLEIIPIIKDTHVIYINIFEFAEFIESKIKALQKKFNIEFTNPNKINKDDMQVPIVSKLDGTYNIYELRNGKFNFFDFVRNYYIYSNLLEGNNIFLDRKTFFDHIYILKFTYYNNENFDVIIDLPTIKNYEHSVVQIHDFLQNKLSNLNAIQPTFYNFKSDVNVQDLVYNINLYFGLLKKMIDWLKPITLESDIIYLNRNFLEIDETFTSLNQGDFFNDFILYNQIQDKDKIDEFILYLEKTFNDLNYNWSSYYNDFELAQNKNLIWNENRYKPMIFQIDEHLKNIKQVLLDYRQRINNSNSNHIEIFEETPEEKDAKVKFILLKEFGIIDFLISQNYNNSEIGKILSPIAQIKSTYIENILTADFKFPDYTSNKSAYKKKNIIKALNEIDKMDISFKNCKYLPTLKINNPELF